MKSHDMNFTTGPILGPLIRFALPVFLAMFLQSMYGAVDLLIVGQFGTAADVSGVSTGAEITNTVMRLVTGLAMGTTILLGRAIGESKPREGGEIMGSSICFFAVLSLVFSGLVPLGAPALATVMQAPSEAFGETVSYIRICGLGSAIIIAYNLIGSIFRGMGDSRTPLITVAIACVFNIAGDLLLVAVFHMGAAGAAWATVAAQLVSVIASLVMLRGLKLPFDFDRSCLRFSRRLIGKVTRLGAPIALQDLLVSISFLFVLAIVNSLGLMESAGVGVAEKVCGFIMLVPSAFSQSMAAFVSQNMGAGRYDRARKGLLSALAVSAGAGAVMFVVSFFGGRLLSGIFSPQEEVVEKAAQYLKAYGIDCLLTCFMFVMVGFFNGLGTTTFTMAQGIIGAFCVRIPVSFLMSRLVPGSLFAIGLATPCSTLVQLLLCLWWMKKCDRRFGASQAIPGQALPSEKD